RNWAGQKKPDGIVSLPPSTLSFRAAMLHHKYTIVALIIAAQSSAETFLGEANLVTYLKKAYPFLIGPFRRMRKGTQWIEPTSGFYEDARNGGDPGKLSERAF